MSLASGGLVCICISIYPAPVQMGAGMTGGVTDGTRGAGLMPANEPVCQFAACCNFVGSGIRSLEARDVNAAAYGWRIGYGAPAWIANGYQWV